MIVPLFVLLTGFCSVAPADMELKEAVDTEEVSESIEVGQSQ